MGATGLSRISPHQAQTLARAITRRIMHMSVLAARPWLLRILLVPWHCYGALDRRCAMILLAAVQSWITPLTLSPPPSAVIQGRQTMFMGGVGLIFRRPFPPRVRCTVFLVGFRRQ